MKKIKNVIIIGLVILNIFALATIRKNERENKNLKLTNGQLIELNYASYKRMSKMLDEGWLSTDVVESIDKSNYDVREKYDNWQKIVYDAYDVDYDEIVEMYNDFNNEK